MLLVINDSKTIADLQDKFNECFPNLRIEFYDIRHRWQQGSVEARKIDTDRRVGDIRKYHNYGVFDIKSWYKTGRVEQDLRNVFGLYAKIFFMKDHQWVQSVAADDLTLSFLNEQGN